MIYNPLELIFVLFPRNKVKSKVKIWVIVYLKDLVIRPTCCCTQSPRGVAAVVITYASLAGYTLKRRSPDTALLHWQTLTCMNAKQLDNCKVVPRWRLYLSDNVAVVQNMLKFICLSIKSCSCF